VRRNEATPATQLDANLPNSCASTLTTGSSGRPARKFETTCFGPAECGIEQSCLKYHCRLGDGPIATAVSDRAVVWNPRPWNWRAQASFPFLSPPHSRCPFVGKFQTARGLRRSSVESRRRGPRRKRGSGPLAEGSECPEGRLAGRRACPRSQTSGCSATSELEGQVRSDRDTGILMRK
jgi:hypothetical protein